MNIEQVIKPGNDLQFVTVAFLVFILAGFYIWLRWRNERRGLSENQAASEEQIKVWIAAVRDLREGLDGEFRKEFSEIWRGYERLSDRVIKLSESIAELKGRLDEHNR